MFESHRRNLGAKALFNAFALLAGSSSIGFWFSEELPFGIKIASGVILVVIFSVAWLMSSPKAAEREEEEGLND